MAKLIRNFDLTVDEIKVIKAIKELTTALDNLKFKDPDSDRAIFFRRQIEALEAKLEELRENTLIR